AGKNTVENNSLGKDEDELQREHGNRPVKVILINPMKPNVLDGEGDPLKAGGGWLGKISINKVQQNKHVLGTNEYKIASEAGLNKSIITVPAQSLLPKLGTGQQVGNLPVGSPGSKERINYGQNIGNYIDPQTGVSALTTNGIVHYGKNSVHIVPARPSEE
ncbi:polymorphic toxin type 50 domain-containing protein, partial [Candidatus Pantoea deserta]|uniref:polymorphic toxin type 50 domain-containing protein n=1 Tax=Candidatus Pantoea deserta TaxID=1869313 RepID=UPI001F1B8F32